ncbi:hypothetical protein SXCC_03180 [Gluconacetobacter sp. SXCC-1]|nr:hypothetical protein SXCC_03180 [Gluconacetobacter sp. SXCC-1]
MDKEHRSHPHGLHAMGGERRHDGPDEPEGFLLSVTICFISIYYRTNY